MSKGLKLAVGTSVAALLIALSGGMALAVSGGGYDPAQQDCSPHAESNIAPDGETEPGCHAGKINVEDSSGRRYAELGLDQLPDGYPSTPGLFGVGYPGSPNFPHSGCFAVNTNGTGGECGDNPAGLGLSGIFDTDDTSRIGVTPASGTPDVAGLASAVAGGMAFYMSADDNLDAGEHDGASGLNGTDRSINGPSDGGAIQLSLSPSDAAATPTLANPVHLLMASFGACADGVCVDLGTRQQRQYAGSASGNSSRDVTDYSGKQWDPYDCSSGSVNSEQQCNDATHADMNSYRDGEAHNVNTEPGVQVYEDPDAQASPIDPLFEAGATPVLLYPLIGLYVGTCGVTAGGGPAFAAVAPPGTLPTNSANQVVVPTGC